MSPLSHQEGHRCPRSIFHLKPYVESAVQNLVAMCSPQGPLPFLPSPGMCPQSSASQLFPHKSPQSELINFEGLCEILKTQNFYLTAERVTNTFNIL